MGKPCAVYRHNRNGGGAKALSYLYAWRYKRAGLRLLGQGLQDNNSDRAALTQQGRPTAAVPPSSVMNARRLMCAPLSRGSHPTTPSSENRVVHHSKSWRPMSQLGQKRRFRRQSGHGCTFAAKNILSFDNIVGALLEEQRHVEAERFRCLEIDDKFACQVRPRIRSPWVGTDGPRGPIRTM
jgi:hypothetical protein